MASKVGEIPPKMTPQAYSQACNDYQVNKIEVFDHVVKSH